MQCSDLYQMFVISRLLKAVLSSSLTHLKQYQRRNNPLRECFTGLLKYLWVQWKKAQESKRKKALEAESLFRWRTKEHCVGQSDQSDYSSNNSYIESIFPSFDEDFTDINEPEVISTHSEPSNIEDSDVSIDDISGCDFLMLNDTEKNLICNLHMLLHHKKPLAQFEAIEDPAYDLYHLASYCISRTSAVPGLLRITSIMEKAGNNIFKCTCAYISWHLMPILLVIMFIKVLEELTL